MPHVAQRHMGLLVPIGLVPTTRTGLSLVGATGRDDLWRLFELLAFLVPERDEVFFLGYRWSSSFA
jgi:hypothetical protein